MQSVAPKYFLLTRTVDNYLNSIRFILVNNSWILLTISDLRPETCNLDEVFGFDYMIDPSEIKSNPSLYNPQWFLNISNNIDDGFSEDFQI